MAKGSLFGLHLKIGRVARAGKRFSYTPEKDDEGHVLIVVNGRRQPCAAARCPPCDNHCSIYGYFCDGDMTRTVFIGLEQHHNAGAFETCSGVF